MKQIEHKPTKWEITYGMYNLFHVKGTTDFCALGAPCEACPEFKRMCDDCKVFYMMHGRRMCTVERSHNE